MPGSPVPPRGRLLILFTHQTAQQERDGSGELHLVRRTRDGDWWFYPEPVFEGRQGEPRAMGTLTTLESGRIIAPLRRAEPPLLQQPPPAAVFRGPRRNLGRQ